MIDTRTQLKIVLNYEFNKYFPKGKKEYIKDLILASNRYYIWKYVSRLRKTEFYKNTKRTIFYIFSLRRKNLLGKKLGFEIPENCFEKGLLIYHTGPIIVNSDAHIGEDCEIIGDCCIGNTEKGSKCPVIGNRVCIGRGVFIIGDVYVADDSIIAACALVTKKFEEKGMVLVGAPAIARKKK